MNVASFTVIAVLVVTAGVSEGGLSKRQIESFDFSCPESSGNFADPKFCRRFYQCVDGKPFAIHCPANLYFDDVDKFCTFKNQARCGPVATTPAPIPVASDQLAMPCNPSQCTLPNCFCSSDGTQIPGGLQAADTPQIVLISMDGSVGQSNYQSYRNVFVNHTNPNGCPIRGTFFVSHEYSNYQMIQQLHYEGHELATYSISQRENFDELNYADWTNEEIGMREILKNFANISKDDILGMRAPQLRPGRNAQYEMLTDFGYLWDSSLSVPPIKTPIWPYSLDYAIPHECRAGTCPTHSFPGVWEFPVNSHYIGSLDGGYCPYLDQCVLQNADTDDVVSWLQEDFARYYDQNRAPYQLVFHTSWFQQENLVSGLRKFINWMSQKPDVWFLTYTQALLWITDPQPISKLSNYESWDCTKRVLPRQPCNNAVSCALPFKSDSSDGMRYMASCFKCPNVYPWLGDAAGKDAGVKDVYEPTNVSQNSRTTTALPDSPTIDSNDTTRQ